MASVNVDVHQHGHNTHGDTPLKSEPSPSSSPTTKASCPHPSFIKRSAIDLDLSYSNMDNIPAAATYPPKWVAAAKAFREEMLMVRDNNEGVGEGNGENQNQKQQRVDYSRAILNISYSSSATNDSKKIDVKKNGDFLFKDVVISNDPTDRHVYDLFFPPFSRPSSLPSPLPSATLMSDATPKTGQQPIPQTSTTTTTIAAVADAASLSSSAAASRQQHVTPNAPNITTTTTAAAATDNTNDAVNIKKKRIAIPLTYEEEEGEAAPSSPANDASNNNTNNEKKKKKKIKGIIAFIHGGWWVAFDSKVWSHLARGLVLNGYIVAMPTYSLATGATAAAAPSPSSSQTQAPPPSLSSKPPTRIRDITQEIRNAIVSIATTISRKGSGAGGEGEDADDDDEDIPITICGHSAGGHLAARMLCADVSLPPCVRARIQRVVPISPLVVLEQLMPLTINKKLLQIDAEEALTEDPSHYDPLTERQRYCCGGGSNTKEGGSGGPLIKTPLLPNTTIHVTVGSDELATFLYHAKHLQQAWGPQLQKQREALTLAAAPPSLPSPSSPYCCGCEWSLIPNTHHFDVLDGMCEADSMLTRIIMGADK